VSIGESRATLDGGLGGVSQQPVRDSYSTVFEIENVTLRQKSPCLWCAFAAIIE
jgi:hypothetical protein